MKQYPDKLELNWDEWREIEKFLAEKCPHTRGYRHIIWSMKKEQYEEIMNGSTEVFKLFPNQISTEHSSVMDTTETMGDPLSDADDTDKQKKTLQ